MAIPEEDFESLVRRHQAMVYRIAAGFFASRAVAEEIVQDVFLQCFENLKAFDSAEHVKSLLRRVATHRCIDVIRTGASQKERQLDELPDVKVHRPQADPLLSEVLRGLVASLPEKLRMVVILRFSEDLSSDEIGEILDIPASTVRSHLQRALATLREKAQRAFGEEIYGPIRKESS